MAMIIKTRSPFHFVCYVGLLAGRAMGLYLLVQISIWQCSETGLLSTTFLSMEMEMGSGSGVWMWLIEM
jgi:hypothetical protein